MSRRGTIRQAEDGTWSFVVDVSPLGAPRKQIRRRGFPLKRDAQKALTDLLHSVGEGSFAQPDRITCSEWFERWFEILVVEKKAPSTIASYKQMIKSHVEPAIGAGRLQSLTTTDLSRLYANLGRLDGRPGGLSSRTTRYIATVVGTALQAAVEQGLVSRNVGRAATKPDMETSTKAEQFWTPEEARRFLDAVEGDDLHPLFRLALMTGARRGEIVGLLWRDVDLDAGHILIRRQIVPVDHEPQVRELTKSKARRKVSLDPETISILRAHRARQLERRLMLGVGWRQGDGVVFDNGVGEYLDPQLVSASFDYRVKKFGMPKISIHGCRHSHASHLLAAGENIVVVSRRLGHKNPAVTLNVYSHLMPTDDADAAVAVAALVDGQIL